MRIALGMDHHGVRLVAALLEHLPAAGHVATRLGPAGDGSWDYPDSVYPVARAVAAGEADRGILVCGTGIGACIAANKVPGVRAALVHEQRGAELSRRHNDANVLCLPGDALSPEETLRITDVWLTSPFDGGRHERRVEKIRAMERGEDPVAAAR